MIDDDDARPEGSERPDHYWSMEHYSYRDPAAEVQAATTSLGRSSVSRGRRRRFAAASVLGLVLVGGVASIAAAQSTPAPTPSTTQVEPVDQHDGFGGHDHPGRGR